MIPEFIWTSPSFGSNERMTSLCFCICVLLHILSPKKGTSFFGGCRLGLCILSMLN